MTETDGTWLVNELLHKMRAAVLVDAALGSARGFAYDVKHGRQTLSDDQLAKARIMNEVFTDITVHEGDAAARLWFIGGNPLLAGTTPLTAIREGLYEAVRDAARAFIRGDPDE